MNKMIKGKLYKYTYAGKMIVPKRTFILIFVERKGYFDNVISENKLSTISHTECTIERLS